MDRIACEADEVELPFHPSPLGALDPPRAVVHAAHKLAQEVACQGYRPIHHLWTHRHDDRQAPPQRARDRLYSRPRGLPAARALLGHHAGADAVQPCRRTR